MASSRGWSEESLFRDYWDDGLMDLLAGLALLVAGIGWQTRLGVLAILQAPLWTLLWRPLRQAVVEPRAGYVAFCKARQRRNRRGNLLAVTLGGIALALVALGICEIDGRFPSTVRTEWAAGLPALIIAAMGAMAALLTGARRFFAYALLSLLAAAAAGWLGWHPGTALGVVGIGLLAGGAWLLARFLRESRAYDAAE